MQRVSEALGAPGSTVVGKSVYRKLKGRTEPGASSLIMLVRYQSDRSRLHETFVCIPGNALLSVIEFVPIRRRQHGRTAHTTV
jgi:hypothetical protein